MFDQIRLIRKIRKFDGSTQQMDDIRNLVMTREDWWGKYHRQLEFIRDEFCYGSIPNIVGTESLDNYGTNASIKNHIEEFRNSLDSSS